MSVGSVLGSAVALTSRCPGLVSSVINYDGYLENSSTVLTSLLPTILD